MLGSVNPKVEPVSRARARGAGRSPERVGKESRAGALFAGAAASNLVEARLRPPFRPAARRGSARSGGSDFACAVARPGERIIRAAYEDPSAG